MSTFDESSPEYEVDIQLGGEFVDGQILAVQAHIGEEIQLMPESGITKFKYTCDAEMVGENRQTCNTPSEPGRPRIRSRLL